MPYQPINKTLPLLDYIAKHPGLTAKRLGYAFHKQVLHTLDRLEEFGVVYHLLGEEGKIWFKKGD